MKTFKGTWENSQLVKQGGGNRVSQADYVPVNFLPGFRNFLSSYDQQFKKKKLDAAIVSLQVNKAGREVNLARWNSHIPGYRRHGRHCEAGIVQYQ